MNTREIIPNTTVDTKLQNFFGIFKKFYQIFIKGKISLYLILFIIYISVRVFLAYNHWVEDEPRVLQKLALYKQQLQRLQSGEIQEGSVAIIEPGAVAIPSKVFDRNGALIGEFFTERRNLLPLSAYPQNLIRALIASEDRKFYEHHGINYMGILRAILRNLIHFRFAQGGSTITQQLAKVLFTNQEKTLDRKLFEFFCAREIEARHSKNEILEMYLNLIYVGHGNYGMDTAAQFYFNKSAKALNMGESAMLVGVIPNPKLFSPVADLPRSLERQQAVFSSLVATGDITAQDRQKLTDKFFSQWRIPSNKSTKSAIGDFPDQSMGKNFAPFFLDYLRQKLAVQFSQDILTKSGLRIYTTLDLNRQMAAQRAVKAAVEIQKKHYSNLIEKARKKNNSAKVAEYEKALGGTNAAFISIEPKTGYILAMVGGAEFSSQNQFNRAVKAERQIGSVIKPILYYIAIAKKILTPASIIEDSPILDYQNYDGKFLGNITLRDALKLSRNPTAVRVLQKLDFDDLRDLFQSILKLPSSDIDKKIPRELGVALGSSSFTPLQIAQVYATMLNRGVRVEPRDLLRVEDHQGRMIWENTTPPPDEQIMDPVAAYITLSMMQAVVSEGGTAEYAFNSLRNAEKQFPYEIAGKTGTTSKYVDAWFAGLVSDESTVMWVGNDGNTTLGSGRSGSGLCAPRFADYLRATRSNENKPKKFNEMIAGDAVTIKSFCPSSGLLPRFPGACADEVIDQVFIPGTEPTEFEPNSSSTEQNPNQQPTTTTPATTNPENQGNIAPP